MNAVLDRYAHLAPVVLRIALGIIFILHGYPKLISSGDFVGFFTHIGIPVPSVMVIVVGLVETVGGLALLAGRWVRLAAGLLAIDMLGAIVLAKRSVGFLNGWEFDFALLAGCLSLMLSSPDEGGQQAGKGFS